MCRRVVVSDSSVLLELERSSLMAAAFSLSLDLCAPDFLYQRELEPYGDHLFGSGLRVLELDGPGILRAVRYRRAAPSLSLFDAFALTLTYRTGAALLTGDGRLWHLATEEGVACHGFLWLIDRIYGERTASLRALCDGLVTLRDHSRRGLPKAEVANASSCSTVLPTAIDPGLLESNF